MMNKMYLYGTKFEVIVDHEPLVSLYKSHSRALPVRVAKHKSKLRAFNFTVHYEPGTTTPSDYGSRHPPPRKNYTAQEREELGVEEKKEDAEIIIARVDSVSEAVTIPILARYTTKEYGQLKEDIQKGRMGAAS